MLAFLANFLLYLIAFLIGAVLAQVVATRVHPATSEREALAELDAAPRTTDGATR